MAIALVSVAGVLAFGWPLLVDPGAALAHGTDAPLVFGLLLPLLMAVVLFEIGEGGLDVKALAMLGVLSAVGAALRPLGAGTAGLETVFFLLVLGGRVFGAGFGFVLGATTLFASALITGGVGPWLPFQMLGAAWVGLGAGLLPRASRARRDRAARRLRGGGGARVRLRDEPVVLAVRGRRRHRPVVRRPATALLENLHRFVLFTLATSLGWDLGRAVTNVVLIALTGRAVLLTLRRAARKAAFDAPVRFDP